MIPPGFYPGAPEGLVLAKIKALGYSVTDFSESYWCEKSTTGDGFFIPKPPDGITYSQEQLNEIANVLEFWGEELLPLDAYLPP